MLPFGEEGFFWGGIGFQLVTVCFAVFSPVGFKGNQCFHVVKTVFLLFIWLWVEIQIVAPVNIPIPTKID